MLFLVIVPLLLDEFNFILRERDGGEGNIYWDLIWKNCEDRKFARISETHSYHLNL